MGRVTSFRVRGKFYRAAIWVLSVSRGVGDSVKNRSGGFWDMTATTTPGSGNGFLISEWMEPTLSTTAMYS